MSGDVTLVSGDMTWHVMTFGRHDRKPSRRQQESLLAGWGNETTPRVSPVLACDSPQSSSDGILQSSCPPMGKSGHYLIKIFIFFFLQSLEKVAELIWNQICHQSFLESTRRRAHRGREASLWMCFLMIESLKCFLSQMDK